MKSNCEDKNRQSRRRTNRKLQINFKTPAENQTEAWYQPYSGMGHNVKRILLEKKIGSKKGRAV